MKSQTVVFLGPTLSHSTGNKILKADYRPPARMGDIYALQATRVKHIILIDGVFHNERSVWQREILAAIDEGITVWGASSMGALRAAELYHFGMIGFGTIFEWYKNNIINGDDEVALHHGPEESNYLAVSEPLVNIRFTLAEAVKSNCLSQEQADQLIILAKGLYYPHRSYQELIKSDLCQKWCEEQRTKLKHFFKHQKVDLKQLDATGVLQHCAKVIGRSEINQNRLINNIDSELNKVTVKAKKNPTLLSATTQNSSKVGNDIIFEDDRLPYQIAHYQFRDFTTSSGAIKGSELFSLLQKPSLLTNELREQLISDWYLLEWSRIKHLSCPKNYQQQFMIQWQKQYEINDLNLWLYNNGLTTNRYHKILKNKALISWLIEQTPQQFSINWNVSDALLIELYITGSLSKWNLIQSNIKCEESMQIPNRKQILKNAKNIPEYKKTIWPTVIRRGFFVDWARYRGVACPSELLTEKMNELKEFGNTIPLATFLNAIEIPRENYQDLVHAYCLSQWLVSHQPSFFGFNCWSFLLAALNELQLTGKIADVLSKSA